MTMHLGQQAGVIDNPRSAIYASPEVVAGHGYDLVVLCAPDFPFIQDGTRRDDGFRARQHAWYQAELARRGIAFVNVSGTVADRVGQVAQALAVA